ncbi:PREDICTED: ras GTPase-activating protein 3-like [Priapulus caudatus]|uniref:Ras GTPase-activating protein 3-like n=1 Tax=Priapulus caudatus TaxID=37621 RepID=A0ABM1EZ77_PRICU|nr:PREDICTED: ras GTPase-activating protein 3-like [Priapulus caudatus]
MHLRYKKVVECSDLQLVSGACDPYVTVTACFSNKQDTRKTRVRKRTVSPQYDDTFVYEVPSEWDCSRDALSANLAELRVAVWHANTTSMMGNVFMGEIKLRLSNFGDDLCKGHDSWYLLQPREESLTARPTLGYLRLNIWYHADHVFNTSQYYSPLRNLLLKSASVNPITSSAAYILGECVPNKIDAAAPLVRVYLHGHNIVPLINRLADKEISKATDPNTLFRGNSLVSKCMDELMRIAGLHYLHDTLKPTLDEIIMERKPCEIDPLKLRDIENLDGNMANLKSYVQKILDAVVNSSLVCPNVMSQVFCGLKQAAIRRFPDSKEVRYLVVSGFIFLRFFAPALMCPKQFELTTEVLDSQTVRTLTLISKTIQSIGNIVSAKSLHHPFKESYMMEIHRTFMDTEHIEAVRNYLDVISSASRTHVKGIETPIVLKEGVMVKRAQGRKRWGVKNFKKRFFCLTNESLTYSKSKGQSPLCTIPIENIRAVERLEEDSFKMKNMFQIVQDQRPLYIQAGNCVEANEWIKMLAKVSQTNKNRLRMYHPAAYLNVHWLCCKEKCEDSPGCTPVTGGLAANIKVSIDVDREIERIHSLFVENMEKLERMLEACESQAVYMGDRRVRPDINVEDPKSCFETLNDIISHVIRLEQEHKQHQKALFQCTKYGSKQAPIGDDNYLMMREAHHSNDSDLKLDVR